MENQFLKSYITKINTISLEKFWKKYKITEILVNNKIINLIHSTKTNIKLDENKKNILKISIIHILTIRLKMILK